MRKRVILIAGLVLAVGSVAAISAPHFRGGHHRHGGVFGDAWDGPGQVRLAERLKEMDKDGAVTLDEFLAQRARQFPRFDRNGDGVIDQAEFAAASKESSDYWVRRLLKRFDADKDGRISKDEFARARKERFAARDLNDDGRLGLEDMPAGKRERVRQWREERGAEGKDAKEGSRFSLDRLLGRSDRRFARLDKNGDGYIDATDLDAVASSRTAEAQQRFLRRFDADRDGKVTSEEFHRFAKQRFANLDLDDDGRITESDLPPMLRDRGLLR
jgi:Ca2+-binding EF-hand superfamily protein